MGFYNDNEYNVGFETSGEKQINLISGLSIRVPEYLNFHNNIRNNVIEISKYFELIYVFPFSVEDLYVLQNRVLFGTNHLTKSEVILLKKLKKLENENERFMLTDDKYYTCLDEIKINLISGLSIIIPKKIYLFIDDEKIKIDMTKYLNYIIEYPFPIEDLYKFQNRVLFCSKYLTQSEITILNNFQKLEFEKNYQKSKKF